MNLLSQLGALSIPEGCTQDLRKQIQRDCYTVMWEQREMRRKLERVRGQQSVDLPKRLADQQEREILMQAMQIQQRMSSF